VRQNLGYGYFSRESARSAKTIDIKHTSAAAGGVSERAIMNQTVHRSLTMVRRYIRNGELFRDDNAARGAGLLRCSKTAGTRSGAAASS
jgi:hypothetical protein